MRRIDNLRSFAVSSRRFRAVELHAVVRAGAGALAVAPFFFIAAAGLGGANPAVDPARPDIMHSRRWGRAEGVRSTSLYAFQAAAKGQSGAGPDASFRLLLITPSLAGPVTQYALKTYRAMWPPRLLRSGLRHGRKGKTAGVARRE